VRMSVSTPGIVILEQSVKSLPTLARLLVG
jgi:hypothetical protein